MLPRVPTEDRMNCPLCGDELDLDFSNAMATCANKKCPLCYQVIKVRAFMAMATEPCMHGLRIPCPDCESCYEEKYDSGGPTYAETQDRVRGLR